MKNKVIFSAILIIIAIGFSSCNQTKTLPADMRYEKALPNKKDKPLKIKYCNT